MQFRRRTLAAILCGIMLLLAACSSGQDAPANADSDAPKELVAVFTAEIESFYPPRVPDRWTFIQVFDPLLHRTPDGTIVGRLAEDWERIDDTTWRFYIREGVKFHNGEPLTAETVKFSIDTFRDPAESTSASRFSFIADVQVLDEYTVDVITAEPFPFTLYALSDNVYMLPQQYLAEHGIDHFAANPIGTGPYKFKDWVKGDRIIMEANDEYWGGPVPIERLVWRVIPEPSARYAALMAGEAHIVADLPPAQVDSVRNSSEVSLKTAPAPRAVYVGLWPDSPVGDGSPLRDVRVRQAINYAVNRQAIVDSLLQGLGTVLSQPIPNEYYLGYDKDLAPYPYDPDKARELLAEAGYPDGFELDFGYTARFLTREQVQAIAADLAQVGIKLNIVEEEWAAYAKRLTENREHWPMYALSIQGQQAVDSYEIYSIAISSKGSYNWNKYTDPEADELIDLMAITFDEAERERLAHQVARITHDNPPWLFLWNNESLWGVKNGVNWQPRADELLSVWDDVSW